VAQAVRAASASVPQASAGPLFHLPAPPCFSSPPSARLGRPHGLRFFEMAEARSREMVGITVPLIILTA
jgi:hypothetical protein